MATVYGIGLPFDHPIWDRLRAIDSAMASWRCVSEWEDGIDRQQKVELERLRKEVIRKRRQEEIERLKKELMEGL